jgi:ribonuclease D
VRGPFVREHGEEVLTIVRTLLEQQLAGTLPPQETAVRREPVFKKREEALKAWRQEKAALRKVTPGVVLPNPLLEGLVASPPPDLAALTQLPFFGEKRLRLYGPELVTLLAGVR